MITVDALCTEMAKSGRPLTTRAARDWWTKGLLPRPRRQSLGRAGFETYWPSASVVTQAVAAHDLLLRHARTDATLVRLWLMGFPIDIDRLRPAWLVLIAKDELPILGAEESGRLPEDAVGDFVASVVRSMTRDRSEIFEHLSTVLLESFNVFFGTDEEIEGYGLAAAAKVYMRHLHPELPGAHQFPWSDEDCVWALGVLRNWCSLPAQREIIAGATEHEFARARRLLQIGLGALGRKRESLQLGSHWPFAIVFGRAAIPVLIKLLRQPCAHQVVDTALQLSRQMRPRGAEVVHAFYQPDAVVSSEKVAQPRSCGPG
jgi:hypothetical protein